jgi:excisionase family DNA binding protein
MPTTFETRQAERLLSRQEAADYLGLKKETLEVWATTKRYDLPFLKVGRLAKYRLADLEQWLASRVKCSTVPTSH